MRDLPRVIGGICVVTFWFFVASGIGVCFGVLLASSIQGGIVW